MVEGNRRLI